MMDGFIEACKAVDKKKNGKKGGRLVRKKRPFLNRLHVGFTSMIGLPRQARDKVITGAKMQTKRLFCFRRAAR